MRLSAARLVASFAVAVVVWLTVQAYGLQQAPHPERALMTAAAEHVERAFAVIDSVKQAEGLAYPEDSPVPWRALLGEDYSAMTTTLGSREAKEASTNPDWAALMVRLLGEAGVAKGDTVAVMVSGSFPALALATAAAVNEMGAKTLMISSLGASSYGANVRGATWLDLERWVREAGVLDLRSRLVTAGGENDSGGGLSDEGVAWLREAARRNGRTLPEYPDLDAAIEARVAVLTAVRPAAVVNIGGGQAALGRCPHTAILPVGLWPEGTGCTCDGRGALTRLAAAGVPVIHLLDIRRLAARYGLDFEPGTRYRNNGLLTTIVRPRRAVVLVGLLAIIASLAWGRTSS